MPQLSSPGNTCSKDARLFKTLLILIQHNAQFLPSIFSEGPDQVVNFRLFIPLYQAYK